MAALLFYALLAIAAPGLAQATAFLVNEDYNSLATGSPLTGWTYSSGGSATIEELPSASNKSVKIDKGSANLTLDKTILPAMSGKNAIIEIRFLTNDAINSKFNINLLGRSEDAVNPANVNFMTLKISGGTLTYYDENQKALSLSGFTVHNQTWYTIKLKVNTDYDVISYYVDDTLLVTDHTKRPIANLSTIRLEQQASVSAYIDDVRAYQDLAASDSSGLFASMEKVRAALGLTGQTQEEKDILSAELAEAVEVYNNPYLSQSDYDQAESSLNEALSLFLGVPPVVTDVAITGTPKTGLPLQSSYVYDAANSRPEGKTKYRWLQSGSANGGFHIIPGAVNAGLIPDDQLVGQYVRLEVTPVDSAGTAGEATASAVIGPVLPGDYQIGDIRVSDLYGNPVLHLEGMDSVQVQVYASFESIVQESGPVALIVELFNGDNKTVASVLTESGITSGSTILLTAQLELPADLTRHYVLVSVVDTTDRMSPLMAPYRFPQLDALTTSVHPQLFLTRSKVDELKNLIVTDQRYMEYWAQVKGIADSAGNPPPYTADKGEQLWLRDVGNKLPFFAMAYLLTEEQAYLDKAEKWALAACGYATWGNSSNKEYTDLPAGHLHKGLALVYDWLYDELSDATKRVILDTLAVRGASLYEALTDDTAVDSWNKAYLQNHLWVKSTGLAISSLAIGSDYKPAQAWFDAVLSKYYHTMDALGDDGANIEGPGYAQYGLDYMLKFMVLSKELFGIDLFEDHPWFENQSSFFINFMLPKDYWTKSENIMDFADSPRYNWYGPDHLLNKLASEYNDGYAQWLADEIHEQRIEDAASDGWINLLWYNKDIVAQHANQLPAFKHFTDLDMITARSGWDGNESLVFFKSGAALGKYATDKFSYDSSQPNYISKATGGHIHPDANAFAIFGEGEFLIPNGGYNYRRTDYENTLLVNGQGQRGQANSMNWFDHSAELADKLHPEIIKAVSTEQMDYMVGDAAASYAELTRFQRHLVYLKPNVLLVIDDINANQVNDLKLLFHAEQTSERVTREAGGAYLVAGDRSLLRVDVLTPEDVTVNGADMDILNRSGVVADKKFTVSVGSSSAALRNVTAFSWSGLQEVPVEASMVKAGEVWTITAGDTSIVLDWSSGELLVNVQ
jgi:hypothetical protein